MCAGRCKEIERFGRSRAVLKIELPLQYLAGITGTCLPARKILGELRHLRARVVLPVEKFAAAKGFSGYVRQVHLSRLAKNQRARQRTLDSVLPKDRYDAHHGIN
jgi:hypothetical protein